MPHVRRINSRRSRGQVMRTRANSGTRRHQLLAVTGLVIVAWIHAASAATLDELNFLIPGGPGGGWDTTARGTGEALVKAGIVGDVSYQNLSGGGGGRAIAKLIETAPRQRSTLLVNSTPMIVRSLQKIFPHSFRDLRPIASVIADHGAFVVRADSALKTWDDVVAAFNKNPRQLKVAGGSVRGSTDHLIFARAIQLAGGNPRRVLYIPYDAGGKAMAGLLTGETDILSTGFGEAVDMYRAGEVRYIGIAADERIADAPDVPTLRSQGCDVVFANWRGFFAAPGHSDEVYARLSAALAALVVSDAFAEVRRRHGWSLHYRTDADFVTFLTQQETEIGQLMRELGFLRK